jgi:response regulator RpfG family c-di-GMP phosphodiesterase
MMPIPPALHDHMYALAVETRTPAYIVLDTQDRLESSSGDLARYGITNLVFGEYAHEHLYCLDGFLPVGEIPLFLSCMKVGTGCSADIHVCKRDGKTWVLFLDATEQEAYQAVLRQRTNELSLLKDQQAIYIRKLEEMSRRIQDHNLELEERVSEQVNQITDGHIGMIFAIAKMAESRDPETGEHLERIREYCKIIAEYLRSLPKYKEVIDDVFIKNVYTSSPLHDIGKVGVPDKILQKPGGLSEEEFDIMKEHAMIGERTLKEVDDQFPGNDFVHHGVQIAGSHHEKWDGSGYPRGLVGEEIPLVGRILALGDSYEALTSKRCYKEPYSHEKSRMIIIEGRGSHFDPDMVDAFLACEDQFIEVRKRFDDPE